MLTSALAIGGSRFIEKVRRNVLKDKGLNSNERKWRRLLPFKDVMKAVEEVKGELWKDFENRYGDRGRDLALYVGRMRCGLTLCELGKQTGVKMQTVSKAVSRIGRRVDSDEDLREAYEKVLGLLGENRGE